MKSITKSISVSPNLHRYIMDHKDADHKSAEAVIYGLVGENDEMKKVISGLSAEEINYILSFMDKSTDYCTSEDDYKFDEELKKKLVKMIK